MSYSIQTLKVKLSPTFSTDVIIALPPNYDGSGAVKYPIVYVGMGLSEPLSSVRTTGIFGLLAKGFIPSATPFIFVHIHQGSACHIDYVPYTTDQLINVHKFKIDTDNSFIVGHSAGGGYACSAQFGRNGGAVDATIIGKRFRGIVAQAPNQDMNENNWGMAAQLQIPMWITVGGSDQLAYINRSQRIYDNSVGKTFVELLIRPGIGHGGWDAVYNGSVKMKDGNNIWQFFTANLLVKPVDNTPYVVQEVVLKLGLGVLRVYSDGTYKVTSQ